MKKMFFCMVLCLLIAVNTGFAITQGADYSVEDPISLKVTRVSTLKNQVKDPIDTIVCRDTQIKYNYELGGGNYFIGYLSEYANGVGTDAVKNVLEKEIGRPLQKKKTFPITMIGKKDEIREYYVSETEHLEVEGYVMSTLLKGTVGRMNVPGAIGTFKVKLPWFVNVDVNVLPCPIQLFQPLPGAPLWKAPFLFEVPGSKGKVIPHSGKQMDDSGISVEIIELDLVETGPLDTKVSVPIAKAIKNFGTPNLKQLRNENVKIIIIHPDGTKTTSSAHVDKHGNVAEATEDKITMSLLIPEYILNEMISSQTPDLVFYEALADKKIKIRGETLGGKAEVFWNKIVSVFVIKKTIVVQG